MVSDNFKFSEHCTVISKNAYKVANMIFRCFQTNNTNALMTAYKAYVRPTLEYCCQAWSPYLLKDIDLLENVQRYYSRRVFARCGLPDSGYVNRMSFLDLEPLETRRIKMDLNFCFNIVKNHTDLNFADFFSWARFIGARDHELKLEKLRASSNILLNSFPYRVVQYWNDLPAAVVQCQSINSFKDKVSNLRFDKYTKFDRHL